MANNINIRAYYGRYKYECTPILVTLIKNRTLGYPSIHERINDREYTAAVYSWVKYKFVRPSYFELLKCK